MLGLSPWVIAAEAALRSGRQAKRAYHRLFDRLDAAYVTDDDLHHSLRGKSLADVAKRIRVGDRLHLTPGLAEPSRTAEAINDLYPNAAREAAAEAADIIAHRIPVFGRACELGEQIEWRADPTTSVSWPLDHWTRVPIRLAEGSDIRAVWELNRLHQLTTLGEAYAFTGDEHYTTEFLAQLNAWNLQNPPGFGPNWVVAMEVAIRAVNLIAALELFRSSPVLGDKDIALILKMLLAHGRFIRANIEFSFRKTSNHYLSDLIGLFTIGATLPDLAESAVWLTFSTTRLKTEMEKQVLPDGVNYEGTTAYHRFVVEIFTLFFVLARRLGVDLGPRFSERLEAMFDFVRFYIKPDGSAPSLGDSDDGRLLRFKTRPPLDHSYLMPLAAVLFGDGRFRQSEAVDDEVIWWFGPNARQKFEALPFSKHLPGSKGFVNSQIFVQRAGRFYAIIDCGDHGARGHGSHAHSDALSIEIFAGDRTFLRDPGTFVYTANEGLRNLFRSTAYHNTVRIDRRDISLIREGEPFVLGPNVRPTVHRWESTDEQDVLDASHDGYLSLDQPVQHRRIITFNKREVGWLIEDVFTGSGSHLFEFFFNFDNPIQIEVEDTGRITAVAGESILTIDPCSGLDFEVERAERWVSPSYGVRNAASAIIYRLRSEVPFESKFRIGFKIRI